MTWRKAMEDRKAVARRVLQGQEAAREKNLLSGAHFAENNRKKCGKHCIIQQKIRIFATPFPPHEMVLSLL